MAAPTNLAAPYNTFTYQGCYTDNLGFRALGALGSVPGAPASVDVQTCIDACRAARYAWAGIEYSYEVPSLPISTDMELMFDQCWCGDTLNGAATLSPDTECSNACNADSSEYVCLKLPSL